MISYRNISIVQFYTTLNKGSSVDSYIRSVCLGLDVNLSHNYYWLHNHQQGGIFLYITMYLDRVDLMVGFNHIYQYRLGWIHCKFYILLKKNCF